MKDRASLRQPLILYALLFLSAAALVVLTLASVAMVRTSQRAYRRAALAQLHRLARLPAPERARAVLDTPLDEVSLVEVSAQQRAGPVSLEEARRAEWAGRGSLLAVRVRRAPEETFLVARLDLTIPTSMAFSEVSRLAPLVVFGTLILSALLVFVTSRLVIRPLGDLAAAAEASAFEEEEEDSSLSQDRTLPANEIVEVAHRFRRTVKRLRSEQDVIRAQKEELERMQESLIRASRLASVGRLAAGIAHEVGNPLAAVKGYLSLMKSGLEPAQQADAVSRSLREVTRMHDTIKKLLTFARSGEDEAGPIRSVQLAAVILQARDVTAGHPALRDARWRMHVESTDRVWAHPDRLGQIFVNLFLNAGQAMTEANSSPMIIEVTVERDHDRRLVHVDDTGPGVSTEIRSVVFDPFFTTKEPGEGTGLGLAVSRAMVEAMNGDLRLARAPGGGARFTVELTAAEPDNDSTSRPESD